MKTLHRLPNLPLLALVAFVLASCEHVDPAVTSVPVKFVVTVPASTPADAEIWISGDQEVLGAWNGRGIQLSEAPDGSFTGEADFAPGGTMLWKVTRGSWDTVEKGPAGEEVENHAYTVLLRDNEARATVATWRDQVDNSVPHTTTGNIKYHTGFTSAFVQTRDIIIYLPPDYDTNPTRSYPVLYLHDGQNTMNRATSFLGIEWQADETAQTLIATGQIEPLILVGAYNTSDRIPEYTPVADASYGGGNADNYGKFLKQELKPFIDSTYRTKPEAQYTGVLGSSLGGLVSMYFGLTLSDTFTRIGVVSPSVWWANWDIVTRVNNLPAKLPLKIWEDIGTAEGTEAVPGARALRDALVSKGWVLDTDLKYLEVSGAQHNETAWAARFDQMLRFLYPPP